MSSVEPKREEDLLVTGYCCIKLVITGRPFYKPYLDVTRLRGLDQIPRGAVRDLRLGS